MKYDKLFDEVYALVAINTAYPNSADHFVKGEHPDWQDESGGVGLEVVKAMTPHMGCVRNLANQYLGKDIKSIPLKNRKGFIGDFYTVKGKLFAISDSKGAVEGTRHVELAINATDAKLHLLNQSHFMLFSQNRLFIYVPFSILDSDLELFCILYSRIESQFTNKFSEIYLFDNVSLFQIKTNKMDVDKYSYSNDQLSLIKRCSIYLQEFSSWEANDTFSSNYRRAIGHL